MKNTHIKNLLQEVPANIRLEVYKEAIYAIENKTIKSMSRVVTGLCLVLPVVLWELENIHSLTPNDTHWKYDDTTIAFPELTEEVVIDISNARLRFDDSKRIEYLNKWIKELES